MTRTARLDLGEEPGGPSAAKICVWIKAKLLQYLFEDSLACVCGSQVDNTKVCSSIKIRNRDSPLEGRSMVGERW